MRARADPVEPLPGSARLIAMVVAVHMARVYIQIFRDKTALHYAL